MNKKVVRGLWILAGCCFIIASLINLISNTGKWYIMIIQLVTAILMFLSEYKIKNSIKK
ncbi:hypothetical protein [Caloramator proteoclasticus]|uniref:Uncharacterized protein n=1 Tax=Caloramator proteoclasticus DSM 10124 TaxID=1121262 RepID=A0A1M4UWD2_9CLOT|nr:hypothetical protein [Caloramator proteoclasticus]SHE60969.1 hypothetical protein SAMN02746091_00753 [Caloramator proteoclasticus DSM 10124]